MKLEQTQESSFKLRCEGVKLLNPGVFVKGDPLGTCWLKASQRARGFLLIFGAMLPEGPKTLESGNRARIKPTIPRY